MTMRLQRWTVRVLVLGVCGVLLSAGPAAPPPLVPGEPPPRDVRKLREEGRRLLALTESPGPAWEALQPELTAIIGGRAGRDAADRLAPTIQQWLRDGDARWRRAGAVAAGVCGAFTGRFDECLQYTRATGESFPLYLPTIVVAEELRPELGDYVVEYVLCRIERDRWTFYLEGKRPTGIFPLEMGVLSQLPMTDKVERFLLNYPFEPMSYPMVRALEARQGSEERRQPPYREFSEYYRALIVARGLKEPFLKLLRERGMESWVDERPDGLVRGHWQVYAETGPIMGTRPGFTVATQPATREPEP